MAILIDEDSGQRVIDGRRYAAHPRTSETRTATLDRLAEAQLTPPQAESVSPAQPVRGGAVALDDPAAFMSPDLDTQPELAASIYNSAGLAYLNRGHVEPARKHIERSLQMRRSFYGEEHPAVADSLQSRARMYRHDGDLKAAEADIRRALSIHSRVNGKGSLAVAATLWELSVIQLENAELAAAERSALEGLGSIEQLYLEHCDPYVPRLLDVVARVRSARGEHADAAEIYAKVLHLVAEKQGKNHPKYATYIANLGAVEEARGNLSEAEDCYRAGIAIYERVNERHPNLSGIYVNMGSLLQSCGSERFAEARSFYQKALQLSETIWGPDHHFHAYDQYSLARLEFDSGNLIEARRLAEAALKTYRVTLPECAYTAGVLALIARILVEGDGGTPSADAAVRQLELERAKGLLSDAIPIFRREFGERSLHFAFARGLQGRARFLLGEPKAEAAKVIASAHACAHELGGEQHKIAVKLAGWLSEIEQAEHLHLLPPGIAG